MISDYLLVIINVDVIYCRTNIYVAAHLLCDFDARLFVICQMRKLSITPDTARITVSSCRRNEKKYIY